MQPEQLSYIDYRDSLVVFADLLGMSRKVQSIDDEDSFKIVGFTLGMLREQANAWRSLDGMLQELAATVVSDSLIVSMPWHSEVAATALIHAMHHFQYKLLLHTGHVLRGYMSRGMLYHKDALLFGEGYIRAWKGEQEQKNGPPRIVLDPELAEYALSIGANQPKDGYVSAFEALRYDDYDGLWYIDYLKPLNLRDEHNLEERRADREKIRVWIQKQKATHQRDYHICSKYYWLEQYESSTRAEFKNSLSEAAKLNQLRAPNEATESRTGESK